jgi:hypothetical protein
MPHFLLVILGKRSFVIFTFILLAFPSTGSAQQNLFNVPSSEITEKNKIFFQQQFNIGALAGNSNTTIDYGLGNNLEVGINLFNLDLYPTNSGIHNPHLLFNFQKAFDITDFYKMSFGTQTGITPPLYHSKISVPSFSYFNNAFDMDNWGNYYLGVYYANRAYVGPGENVGLMAGVDLPIMKGKVHLMGDVMTGNNDISVGVVGAVLYLPNNWQLSFGAQLPVPGSNNDYGMVFEITKL